MKYRSFYFTIIRNRIEVQCVIIFLLHEGTLCFIHFLRNERNERKQGDMFYTERALVQCFVTHQVKKLPNRTGKQCMWFIDIPYQCIKVNTSNSTERKYIPNFKTEFLSKMSLNVLCI